MRRSHSGSVGWRNDNPRHFRPRGGGAPHFRPGRGYGHGDTPRFPGPRFPGPRPYHNARPSEYMHRDQDRDYRSSRQNSQRYSVDNRERERDRSQPFPGNQGQRQIFPLLQRMRHEPADQNFYEDQDSRQFKNLKDVDDRQSGGGSRSRESFTQRAPPWERRSPIKQFRNQEDHNKLPEADHPGHRPPASDHYGSNQESTIENSKTFSRSVDDTVNIVRERLLSRESHPSCDPPPSNHSTAGNSRQPATAVSQPPPQERTAKKKPLKAKNIKTNCDKIKNKIVHQLFKMDKDKIHKLMDNPNSSSKFEYAISSLITESQNSYNRHLRSVAEKSLGTSTEFVHNNTNTIYEDTFMKQMQGLLDPQDTVLLEDIKPMVLAELCKVLQLDDIEQRVEYEEQPYPSKEQHPYPNEFHTDYTNFADDIYSPTNEMDSSFEQKVNMENRSQTTGFERSKSPNRNEDSTDFGNFSEPKPLFERRPPKNVDSHNSKSASVRQKSERQSIDYKPEDGFHRSRTSVPVFEQVTERYSEEDPFTALDRQYHVAIDPNFIDTERNSSPNQSNNQAPSHARPTQPLLLKETPKVIEKPVLTVKPQTVFKNADNPSIQIKEQIDNLMQNMVKPPFKFMSPPNRNETGIPTKSKETLIKRGLLNECTSSKSTDSTGCQTPESMSRENISKSNAAEVTREISNNCSSLIRASRPTDPRKRPADIIRDQQKPSHRKEKRKRCESPPDSTTKEQILNKNISINPSDSAKDWASDKQYDNSPKPIANVYFSKNKSIKEAPKVESNDKGYSDKYVKRKDNTPLSKKPKEESKQKSDTSSSHSTSPAQTSTASIQTNTKPDAQIKLKPIDLFTGPAKKPTTVYQAPRNTAPVPVPTPKTVVETKPIIISRKLTKRHVATQVVRKIFSKEVQTEENKSSCTRYCQTDRKRLISRGSQTDAVSFKSVAKVDPLERMKQIDMEIQTLLHEKFKLYNSIENPEPCGSSLGMAVLNPVEEDEPELEDEFANIPVEELEQIAFDSEVEEQDDSLTENQNQQSTMERGASRNCSQSPASSVSSGRSRRKAPNISLIEQIITDDRPLEDIISLDDFEESPDKRRLSKSDRRLDDIMSLSEITETPQRKNSQNTDKPLENAVSLDALDRSPQQKKAEKTDRPVEDITSDEKTQKKDLQKSDEPLEKGVALETLDTSPLNRKSHETDCSIERSLAAFEEESQKIDRPLVEGIPPESSKLPREENTQKMNRSVETSLDSLKGIPQKKKAEKIDKSPESQITDKPVKDIKPLDTVEQSQKTETVISVDTTEGRCLLKKMSQETSFETLRMSPSEKKVQKVDRSVEISVITVEGASQKKKLLKVGKSLRSSVDVLEGTNKKKLPKTDRPLKHIVSLGQKAIAVLSLKKNSQKPEKPLEEGISVETLKTPQRRKSMYMAKALDDSMPIDASAGQIQKKKSLKMDRGLDISPVTKEGTPQKKKSPKKDKSLETDTSRENKEGSPHKKKSPKTYKPLEVITSLDTLERLPQKKKSPRPDKPLKDATSHDTLDGTPQKKHSPKMDTIEVTISPDTLKRFPHRKISMEKDKSPDDNISLDILARQKRRLLRAMSRDSLDEIPQKKKSQKTDKLREDSVSIEDLEGTSPKKISQKTVTFEDSVSVDITEEPLQKRRRRDSRAEPKKKATKKEKKNKASKHVDYLALHGIKPCFVTLELEDMETLMRKAKNPSKFVTKAKTTKMRPQIATDSEITNNSVSLEPIVPEIDKPADTPVQATETVVEVVNDIDMLDVSEDIVIGDDMKAGEKETDSSNPDIILDNSQSSTEGTSGTSASQGECRTFDYSSDENLRRDSIVVSGNGDAVLAVECIDNNFIAACLDGNVYYFNGEGQLLNTLRGSNLAVTCLTIVKETYGTTVYTGSLDSRIRYYDLETGLEKGPECNVLSPIQTMDRAWGTIFVGTRTGFVLQFECKNNILIPVSTVKFSEQSILALRAMKEGPRKVLLVAARSEPVTIKDAQTGLLLRTLEGPKMTVYTLLFEDGKVYCGTSSHQIHVFDYVSGSHVGCHSGGKGAVCLRATGGLIFAGCYDGCVYVYRDGQPQPLAQLKGPGLMLLSLAVHSTKIIAGYKDRSLYIWKIPHNILQEMIL